MIINKLFKIIRNWSKPKISKLKWKNNLKFKFNHKFNLKHKLKWIISLKIKVYKRMNYKNCFKTLTLKQVKLSINNILNKLTIALIKWNKWLLKLIKQLFKFNKKNQYLFNLEYKPKLYYSSIK